MDACRALGTTAWLVGGRDVRSRVAYLFMFLVLQYLRQLRNANSVTPKKKASVTPPMQSKVEGVCASLYISATPDRLRQTLSLTNGPPGDRTFRDKDFGVKRPVAENHW